MTTTSQLGNDDFTPQWFLLLTAILSGLGLALGVSRHYWDIYTHRSVRGISFWFVALDAAGDLTSLLSVGARMPVHLCLIEDVLSLLSDCETD